MPAHTYIRTGRYEDAAEANRRAIAVDKAYLARTNAQGNYSTVYSMMYISHNYQFLWAAASMEGRSAEAIQAARDMAAHFPEEMGHAMERAMPGVDYFISPPLFALVRFGRWSEVLAAPRPPKDFTFLTAVWHYARGTALAATGKTAEARAEHQQLAEFASALPADILIGPTNSARSIFAVAVPLLEGEILLRSGDAAGAVPFLKTAVKAEDELNYDEPPPWPQSSRLSLGEALVQLGKSRQAAEVFREDLKRYPDNGWALFGLSQAVKTATAKRQFERAWRKADVQLSSSRF
jgi:tetratricopeptide (TPR) repeat protein